MFFLFFCFVLFMFCFVFLLYVQPLSTPVLFASDQQKESLNALHCCPCLRCHRGQDFIQSVLPYAQQQCLSQKQQ